MVQPTLPCIRILRVTGAGEKLDGEGEELEGVLADTLEGAEEHLATFLDILPLYRLL